MNFKRILCTVFAAALTLTSLSVFTASAATLNINEPFTGTFVGYSNFKGYKIHDGLVNTRTATLSEVAPVFGKASAVCIAPKSANAPIAIKHDSLADAGIPLRDINYIRYTCYYVGNTPVDRAELVVKQSEFNLTSERKAYAMETISSDGWTSITFNFREFINDYALDGGCLPEMVFYPFGQMSSSELTSEDKLYISDISIWSEDCVNAVIAKQNGELVDTYPVYFVPGRPDAEGENPPMIFIEEGDSVTLPENPYTLEGYKFVGWVCSDGNTVYEPGDEVKINHKTIAGSRATSRTYFVANWIIDGSSDVNILPDIKVVSFGDYNNGTNGVVDQSKGGMYALRTLNYEFDGIKTTRYQFLPDGPGASRIITFDGWTWDSMPLDISHYKYIAFTYYWDTDSTRNYTPRLGLLGSPSDMSKALTTSRYFNGQQLKKNQWAVCGFATDFVNNSTNSKYVRWDTNTIVNQMHFTPFGNGSYAKAQYMSEDDNLYIGNFIFFKDKPSATPTFNEGYVDGYEDGTFKPNKQLTNAEAASLLAKALGATDEALSAQTSTTYTDVDKDDWFFGAVAYLESIGVLRPAARAKFLPDELSSRNSFTGMLLNALSGETDTKTVNPNKIPASTETGPLTRAEAVSNINALLRGTVSATTGSSALKSVFKDVGAGQWFFPDVALASTRAVYYKDASGNTAIADTPTMSKEDAAATEIPDELFEEGEKYVASLDVTTDARINEIRSTESEYTVKPGGKVYYLSSTSGDASGTGLEEYSPKLIKSLDEVSLMPLNPGDVVLFKRGDTFRGKMTAKAGVTYSAFGYGDKPILTRSPANIATKSKWVLDYEDKETGAKIWKYVDYNIVDAGAINLIDSSGEVFVCYKEIPSFQDGRFWVRGEKGVTEYDYKKELDHNFMYFHEAMYSIGTNGELVPTTASVPGTGAVGPIYLRCDEGNPGALFNEITFNLKTNVISCGGANGVTIDNLCILYFGSHGIGAGTIHNLTVRNCEIGWGGGSFQHYGTGNTGDVTRFGNGIEIYGGLVNYVIENCYVYQIYDAGITHQISSTSDGNYSMEGVYYLNNILTHSTYNIEYFMSKNSSTEADGKTLLTRERMMKDVYFTDNIVRLAGYGWGVQRPDSAPSNIKGWTHNNFCDNYVIENNVFDRCVNLRQGEDYVIQVGSSFDNSTPYLKNNIFVQTPGRTLMRFGKATYPTEIDSQETVLNSFAGDGNKLYLYRDDAEQYRHHVYWE